MLEQAHIIHGDSREALKTLDACSIDACVTDPPYALVSITKRFGAVGAAPAKGNDAYTRASSGFMGQRWDTGETAFDPEFWRAVLRVLKPGAHLLAFGGTRTYHRMTCAIEDAGFEIRDMVLWHYGSGFPKSHDVSKGIDRAAGAEREVIRERYTAKRIKPGATVVREGGYGKQEFTFTATDTAPATSEALEWQGWGTALKPASEPICLARKPLSEKTVAANVLRWGTGAINVDACRIGYVSAEDKAAAAAAAAAAEQRSRQTGRNFDGWGMHAQDLSAAAYMSGAASKGRWPANLCHDGSPEVLAAFPDSDGQFASVGPHNGAKTSVNVYGDYGARDTFEPRGDSGSAARFFFCAKADGDDRLGSKHPTVKPVSLMQWLCRLVTPPKGLILDPFAGTGTTGEAAWRENFRAILIEREERFVRDIERRIELMRCGPDERTHRTTQQEPAGTAPLFRTLPAEDAA